MKQTEQDAIIFHTKTQEFSGLGKFGVFGFGRNGVIDAALGREGDAKTPLGDYILRFGFYRADRLSRPRSELTFHPLSPEDGWCDDPDHPAYNRWIKRPFPASYETLWRDDAAYDVILVISHNDSPPVPNLGSAVFIHIRQPDHRPTLGCLTLTPHDMLALLEVVRSGTGIFIR